MPFTVFEWNDEGKYRVDKYNHIPTESYLSLFQALAEENRDLDIAEGKKYSPKWVVLPKGTLKPMMDYTWGFLRMPPYVHTKAMLPEGDRRDAAWIDRHGNGYLIKHETIEEFRKTLDPKSYVTGRTVIISEEGDGMEADEGADQHEGGN
ncbi:hypothetical protein EsH8_II_000002 [Colletotrichum jinshuiense]